MRPLLPVEHGTERGYWQHVAAAKRAGEPIDACTACKAAHALTSAARTGPCAHCGAPRSEKAKFCSGPACLAVARAEAVARRQAARAERAEALRAVAAETFRTEFCGTERGYQRHRSGSKRLDVTRSIPCDDCLAAHRVANGGSAEPPPRLTRQGRRRREVCADLSPQWRRHPANPLIWVAS